MVFYVLAAGLTAGLMGLGVHAVGAATLAVAVVLATRLLVAAVTRPGDGVENAVVKQGGPVSLGPVSVGDADDKSGHSRFLHAVLDGVDLQIGVLDESGRLIETNQAWDDFAGSMRIADESTVGASFYNVCREGGVYEGESPTRIAGAIRQAAAGQGGRFRADYTVLMSDEARTIEVTVAPLPAGYGGSVIVTQRDRTAEQIAAQKTLHEKQRAITLADALEASQSSLDLALQAADLGLWQWDIPTGYFELSDDWIRKLGVDPIDFTPDLGALRSWLHPDDRKIWTARAAAGLAGDEPFDRQFRLRSIGGEYRWFQVLGRAISYDATGAPECLSGILIDIDARKSTELRHAGMAKIIEESMNEVYVVDSQTLRFVEVNCCARENLGYSLTELQSMTPFDLKQEGERSMISERMASIAEGLAPRLDFESLHVRRDGTTYPCLMTLQKTQLLDRDVYVATGMDVTERRRLETQLAQARRLESIGELAAGVAHEMNTPLQYVGNNIQYLSECSAVIFEIVDAFLKSLDPATPSKQWSVRREEVRQLIKKTGFERIRREAPHAIAECREGVERVLQVVRAMKDFSRPESIDLAPADLNHALRNAAIVTRNRWSMAGELDLELDPTLRQVVCQEGAINQVFVNLIVNAADAIVERLQNDPNGPSGKISARTHSDGEWAVFEIEDNGSGMSAEVQRRAFDPFFSTKEVGKGSGQGLALSHAIVSQNHGGAIQIDSTPGVGTVVRVKLPVAGASNKTSDLFPAIVG
ncbi:ATP-binding protein [Botrimarina colliarenosi]|uniref:ATP-binding protein n=1 Tax=Botrimarina colliarenosi TaxID=2528001 RepID=UPI0018D2BED7|nr:ATP-binding protein [Botrimarina colliarenosi]